MGTDRIGGAPAVDAGGSGVLAAATAEAGPAPAVTMAGGGRGVLVDARALGNEVCRLREERGWTTTELARRAGISQAQISRLENGLQGFRSSTLDRIARALGLEARVVFIEP